MNHFHYRDGVLHAEDVAIPEIAAVVGTPFYCYSTATLTRHYKVFAKAFAGMDSLVCYAMKANSNQAVLRVLAKLGAGADVVSEGEMRRALAAGIPAEQDPVLRRRQDRARNGLRARRRHPVLQRRVGARTGAAFGPRHRTRPNGARVAAHQPGCRRQDPQEDLDRQGREQVRHRLAAGARRLCARRRTAGHQGRRHRHAYRQPDHRPAAVRRRLCAACRTGRHAARRRPRDRACRSRRRARHSLPHRQRSAAASRRLWRHRPQAHRAARPQGDVRAGPADRRQCRHPGRAGDLPQGGRRPELPRRRRGDERPDPADAL